MRPAQTIAAAARVYTECAALSPKERAVALAYALARALAAHPLSPAILRAILEQEESPANDDAPESHSRPRIHST